MGTIILQQPPAFLFYVADHLSNSKVARISAAEECYLLRALFYEWLEGGVPSDPQILAKQIGKNCTTKDAATILETFFIPNKKHPGFSINKKLEKVRKEWRERRRRKAEAGRLSGEKRREKRDLTREQNLNRTGTKHEPSSSSAFSSSENDFKRLIETCVREYSKFDKRLVEVAVLETLFRRKESKITEPIKSIKYFGAEIQKMHKDGGKLRTDTIDALLRSRQEKMGIVDKEGKFL